MQPKSRSGVPEMEKDTRILKALLKAGPDHISGADLSRTVKVARGSIGRHIQYLRDQGFDIASHRSYGYRLVREPAEIQPRLIEAYISAPPILFYHYIDSTNNEASRQLESGRAAPFVVLAARQMQGRGRYGRSWDSVASGNLYISFVFRPLWSVEVLQRFTLWMGLQLCHFFVRQEGLTLGLKWPNDLLYQNRKVAGMLTETRVEADRISQLIFGLGINCNDDPSDNDPGLKGIATSLARAHGRPLPLNQIAAAIIKIVGAVYQKTIAQGGIPHKSFDRLWKRYDALSGQTVRVKRDGRSFRGIVRGLHLDGALCLLLEDGSEYQLRSGDVFQLHCNLEDKGRRGR